MGPPSESLLRPTVASLQWDSGCARRRDSPHRTWRPSADNNHDTFGAARFLQEPDKDADKYPFGVFRRGLSNVSSVPSSPTAQSVLSKWIVAGERGETPPIQDASAS